MAMDTPDVHGEDTPLSTEDMAKESLGPIVEEPVGDGPEEWFVTSLTRDLSAVDKVFTKTHDVRDRMIDQLYATVDGMHLSGDPEKLEAQTKLINTLSSLLNDQDTAIYKRASLKMRVKETEDVTAIGANVAELLSRISMKGQRGLSNLTINEDEGRALIAQQFNDRGCVAIEDSELEEDPATVYNLSAVIRDDNEK